MPQSETVTVSRKALDSLIQSARYDHEALIAEFEDTPSEDVQASGDRYEASLRKMLGV